MMESYLHLTDFVQFRDLLSRYVYFNRVACLSLSIMGLPTFVSQLAFVVTFYSIRKNGICLDFYYLELVYHWTLYISLHRKRSLLVCYYPSTIREAFSGL